jgi:hypothetical protein
LKENIKEKLFLRNYNSTPPFVSQGGEIRLQGLTYTIYDGGEQYTYTLTSEYANVGVWSNLGINYRPTR